ncbi:FtsX-like permease family protein [Streptomyces flaveolus]|uniref:FtsX-like permease family protein n=1 Tax=Streptomyces flaveolus TaxID=67297 RepID=UPI003F57FA12
MPLTGSWCLLLPVAVFIAAAVRFGGERRDRRLAALRLVGADGRMTRRIAGGEALAGALLGLVLGAGFFLLGRQSAVLLTVRDISVFPSDLDPSPALVALVAVAVPAAAVLVTLVSQLEQLRERKKLLSSLVAFGTRRRTLALSVLWQTAIPIGLGLLLASAVGLTLGTVLLKMTATKIAVDWTSVLAMTGIGAGVVLGVTLLSLPPLLRLMRPDGLRAE